MTRYVRFAKLRTAKQVSTASIERWLSGMLLAGRSTETRNKAATRLSSFFKWVVERQHLTKNPAANIKRVPSDGGVDEPRALTHDELERLLDATPDPRRRMAYLLGARAGLRVHEAHRLLWSHMNFDGDWIVLPKTLTKMKRAAEIPMNRRVREAALSLTRTSEYVCGPKTPSRYTWLRDLERAGIIRKKDPKLKSGNWSEDDLIGYRDSRGKVVSRRCLRPTFSTHLAAAGASQTRTMQLMRHKSAAMTNELYTDSLLLDLRGAVDKLDAPTKPQAKERTA